MRQSNVIFAALLFAFIVYITVRGQLPSYLALFTRKGSEANGKGSSTASASNTPTSSQSQSGSSPSDTIDTALAVFDRISTMRG